VQKKKGGWRPYFKKKGTKLKISVGRGERRPPRKWLRFIEKMRGGKGGSRGMGGYLRKGIAEKFLQKRGLLGERAVYSLRGWPKSSYFCRSEAERLGNLGRGILHHKKKGGGEHSGKTGRDTPFLFMGGGELRGVGSRKKKETACVPCSGPRSRIRKEERPGGGETNSLRKRGERRRKNSGKGIGVKEGPKEFRMGAGTLSMEVRR